MSDIVMNFIGRGWVFSLLFVGLSVACGCSGCDDDSGATGGRDAGGGDAIGVGDVDLDVDDVSGGADGVGLSDADQADGDQADADQPDVFVCQTTTCDGTCCEAGQECVEDQCLDPCAGTRCGDDLGLCCEGQSVCIAAACVVPGQACQNSFECPEDQYCEATLEACVPRDAIDQSCTYRPPVGEFTPSPETGFAGITDGGRNYHNSITSPAVADVDADGLPEIVAHLYRGGLSSALLVVLNGEDLSVLAYGAVDELAPNAAGVAVGQIDASTPELEIVDTRAGGGVAAYRYDPQAGQLVQMWENSDGALGNISNESAPALADLDGDGTTEIVMGFSVVDAQGDIWNGLNLGAAGNRGGRAATAVVDIDQATDADGDHHPEIVAGNRVLKTDGTLLWDRSGEVPDGYPAVGDFGGDDQPDVVNVANGDVYVLDGADGTTIFGPVGIPGGGSGGPPTVADFDGDGFVEFAAAGRGKYTVYDLDCTDNPDSTRCVSERDDGILWSTTVQDISSSRTGSSVFDFEGDGKAEVVYNDECFLRVFDGRNGDILFEQANSSRTGSEYPIVVDVDADFNAEIVVVSNNDQINRDDCEENYENYPDGGTSGVAVYGDANNNWVPTRGIWNEHTYHITNVLEDGQIPAQETAHYASSITNSFRLNVQPDGLNNAADLVVTDLGMETISCGDALEVAVTVTVKNRGALGVGAGTAVDIVADDGSNTADVGSVSTTQRLLPGQSETLTLTWELPAEFRTSAFLARATADADATINECDEDNNVDEISVDPAELRRGSVRLEDLQLDDVTCGINREVDVAVSVVNQGQAQVPAGISVVIEADIGGQTVTVDTLSTTDAIDAGDTEPLEATVTFPENALGLSSIAVRAQLDADDQLEICTDDEPVEASANCQPPG